MVVAIFIECDWFEETFQMMRINWNRLEIEVLFAEQYGGYCQLRGQMRKRNDSETD